MPMALARIVRAVVVSDAVGGRRTRPPHSWCVPPCRGRVRWLGRLPRPPLPLPRRRRVSPSSPYVGHYMPALVRDQDLRSNMNRMHATRERPHHQTLLSLYRGSLAPELSSRSRGNKSRRGAHSTEQGRWALERPERSNGTHLRLSTPNVSPFTSPWAARFKLEAQAQRRVSVGHALRGCRSDLPY